LGYFKIEEVEPFLLTFFELKHWLINGGIRLFQPLAHH